MLASTASRFDMRRSLLLDSVIIALEAQGLSPARREALRRVKSRLEPRRPMRRLR